MKIAAFGEVLWDVVDKEYHLGGAPLNFAVHAARCGLSSAIISACGNDDLGELAKHKLTSLGINLELLQESFKPTGTVEVTLNNGSPEYNITEEVAYDYINADVIDFEKLKTCNCFYFGTLAQRSSVSRQCLETIFDRLSFELVFCDVNLRQSFYNPFILNFSLSHCTILKVNMEEIHPIAQLFAFPYDEIKAFAQAVSIRFPNIDIIIITKGADGCALWHSGELSEFATESIKVKDTIGAGDSFSAAFCAALLRTNDLRKAIKLANTVGAFVASEKGAIPDYSESLNKKIKQLSI